MNNKRLLALWGLKWNPFTPELPREALLATASIERFAWRVEQLVQEGGFALISGESGTGKSVALRIVAQRLAALRDVIVGVVERPQSKSGDFYRELGDIFSVQLRPSNRWGGFRALRDRWKAHVTATRIRPAQPRWQTHHNQAKHNQAKHNRSHSLSAAGHPTSRSWVWRGPSTCGSRGRWPAASCGSGPGRVRRVPQCRTSPTHRT